MEGYFYLVLRLQLNIEMHPKYEIGSTFKVAKLSFVFTGIF